MAKQPITKTEEITTKTDYDSLRRDKDILTLLGRIVDALYRDDPNISKWKPIRDEIEKLIQG